MSVAVRYIVSAGKPDTKGRQIVVIQADGDIVAEDRIDPAMSFLREKLAKAAIAKASAGRSRVYDPSRDGDYNPHATFPSDDEERQELADRILAASQEAAAEAACNTTEAAADFMPWKPFPTSCLPEPFRRLSEDGAEAVGVDLTCVLLPAIAAAAIAIGNTRRLALNDTWSEPANVWIAVVAPPGSKKTPAFRLATAPLEEAQDGLDDDHQGDDEAPRKALFVTDCTIERLATVLKDNPRGVGMVRDELSSLFQAFTKYRREGSDASQWLELFNDGRLHIHRKTGTPKYVTVRRANVSIAGTIQPAVLKRCFESGNIENGLAGRFLLSAFPKKLSEEYPKSLDKRTANKWKVCIRRLLGMSAPLDDRGQLESVSLKLDSEAEKAWWLFYKEHQHRLHEADGAYAAALSKLERYCLRLALIFHLVNEANDPIGNDESDVSLEAMQSAITATEWFIYETSRIYGQWSATEDHGAHTRVLEWLQAKGGRGTIRLMIAAKVFPNASEGESVLSQLHAMGKVRVETVTRNGRGRPATEYVLRSSVDSS